MITRHLVVYDKNGVKMEITSKEQLDAYLNQMTPEELKSWMIQYRFMPIKNRTGVTTYTGQLRDIL